MDRNNIELKWVVRSKLYSTSGDHIEFRCKPGYLQDPSSSSFRVQCVEGTLKYPRCTPGSKSSPLQLRCSVVAFLVLKGSRKPLPFLAVSQGVGASWMLQEWRGNAPKKSWPSTPELGKGHSGCQQSISPVWDPLANSESIFLQGAVSWTGELWKRTTFGCRRPAIRAITIARESLSCLSARVGTGSSPR